jgi:hypothetical protein
LSLIKIDLLEPRFRHPLLLKIATQNLESTKINKNILLKRKLIIAFQLACFSGYNGAVLIDNQNG